MGKAAKLKTSRRALLAEHRDKVRAEDAARRADPEFMAIVRAGAEDETARAVHEQDRHGQMARLTDDGREHTQHAPDGAGLWSHRRRRLTLDHSVARELDGHVRAHVPIATHGNTMPDWYLVRDAMWLMYPGQFGVIVVAPQSAHASIANVTHVRVKLTGDPATPDFSHGTGSI